MQPTQQREDILKDKQRNVYSAHHITPLDWVRREKQNLAITSWGEYFLPLFLAAIEACWVNAALIGLAGINLLNSSTAFLAFWGPPLLLIGSTWLFRRALQKETSTESEEEQADSLLAIPGLRSLSILVGLSTIVLVWLHLYSSFFLLDPGWLLALGRDMLALNLHFYQTFFILAAALYLCWRGIKLAQMNVTSGDVLRQIGVGLPIFLVAILIHANQTSTGDNADGVVLILLIPFFLYLSLSTHALARIASIRHEHIAGLEGDAATQERTMLNMITIVGLFLLACTLIATNFSNSSFFRVFQPIWQAFFVAYNFLVLAFSFIAAIIVTPFYWLFTWWFSLFPPTALAHLPSLGQSSTSKLPVSPHNPALLLFVKLILPLLLFLLVLFLIRLALRRRKQLKIDFKRKNVDIHESLWSWKLFWGQFQAFWWVFLRRLFHKRLVTEEVVQATEKMSGTPEVRTIREMYRALLKKAALYGYTRERDETPYEFARRLDEHIAESEPQLGMLTEAYALARYGGKQPNASELAIVRQNWQELNQKWEQV